MAFGDVASADDSFLTLRGLRTLGVRQGAPASAMRVAGAKLPTQVAAVLYPPLGRPGHALYARDFSAGGGLFGLLLVIGRVSGNA